MGQFFTKIVGVTFENRQNTIRRLYKNGDLEPGTELVLKRDFGNPFDSNAVGIYAQSGEQLGYVSQERAQIIAAEMRNGVKYRAFVRLVNEGGADINYGVNIQIEYSY